MSDADARFGKAVLSAHDTTVSDAAVQLARAVRRGHLDERAEAAASGLRRILREASR